MRLILNLEKRRTYFVLGLLILVAGIFIVAAAFPNDLTSGAYHSLYRIAKCPNQTICGTSWDSSSVDQNLNGKIDRTDYAETPASEVYTVSGPFSYDPAKAVLFAGQYYTPIGVHDFCYPSTVSVYFSRTDWGNPGCALWVNGNTGEWMLNSGVDRSFSVKCDAMCIDY